MSNDARAIIVGFGVFVVSELAYFVLAAWARDVPVFVGWAIYASGYVPPLLAGSVTGFLAKRQPFVALLVLGFAVAISAGAINFVFGWLGVPVDLGGLNSLPWVIGFSLIVLVPLVVVGGAIGSFLQREPHA